jgi:hypothetical protein
MSIALLVLAGWIGANLVVVATIGLAAILRGHRARRQVARVEAWLRRTPLAPRSASVESLARPPERVARGS